MPTAGTLLTQLAASIPDSVRAFDLGGLGEGVESSRIFDIEGPPFEQSSARLFNIAGSIEGESVRTFDIEGPLESYSARFFDIIASSSSPLAGVNPAGYPVGAPDAVDTTLSALANAGDLTVTVTSATGILVGALLNIDGEYRTIIDVTGTTLTLATALGGGHANGVPVTSVDRVRPQVSRNAAAAATTLVLQSDAGLEPGTLITISGSTYTITALKRDGRTVYITPGLTGSVSSGTGTFAPATYLNAISVFDKTGVQLGLITAYTITSPRSRSIQAPGSMDFFVPRNHPDVELLAADRLVAIGNRVGMPLWAGVMGTQQAVDSYVSVQCPDLFALTSHMSVKLVEELPDNTTAASLYSRIVGLMNEQRAIEGEIQWDVDATGSKPFYGDINFEGDPIEAFNLILARSNTDYAWSARIEGGRLIPTLVARDLMGGTSGAAFSDGPGGNVVARPTYIENPDTVVNEIKLTGAKTNVRAYLPEWAAWAVHEFEPYVELKVDPGDFRRRRNLELRVDWGLSKATQRTLADRTVAQLRQMYLTFLYAFHDQQGRPYHEGWHYEGPPSAIEQFIHTGLGWRTRRALIEVDGKPAASVMYSVPEGQILAVLYDRVIGITSYEVRRLWFSEAAGVQYLTRMHVHGWAYHYETNGGVITGRTLISFDHSRADVSGQPVTLMWPGEGAGSDHPTTTYHTLRRTVSLSEDGAWAEGAYFDTSFITGPTIGPSFVRPGIGDAAFMTLEQIAAPDSVDLDQSFTTKVYDFEELRIHDWDPRRDGVGAFLNRRSIVQNAPSTASRWFVVPWGAPGDTSTIMTVGLGAGDTDIFVESIFGLPLAAQVPFDIEVGEDPGMEHMTVTAMLGTQLTVTRGQAGTPAIVHEPGEQVRYRLPTGVEQWDGFVIHVTDSAGRLLLDGNLLWPEGAAWAAEVLSILQRPTTRLSIKIANRDDAWSTVDLGTQHAVTISTEGMPGGIDGTVRVIGYAIDEVSGQLEVLTEWVV